MAESKIPLIAIVGPTASGKTSLSVEICKRIGGEVVSCDSMQIYKGMDIATAKPTVDEMCGIPHHMMDFLPPDEPYSVAAYCESAKKVIADITSRGKIPVLCGGTGLYYSTLVDNIEFLEQETDFEYRNFLQKTAEEQGAEVLLEMLRKVDPETAEDLHINNLKRIIRALEIYKATGKTKSEQNALSRSRSSDFDLTAICLDARDRAFLYDRINRRVDIMVADGLVEEARQTYTDTLGKTACQAIGHKELYPYFSGEKSLDDCIENLKMQTRRYAKRQLTWFRRDERIKFLFIDDYADSAELADAAIAIIERGVNG